MVLITLLFTLVNWSREVVSCMHKQGANHMFILFLLLHLDLPDLPEIAQKVCYGWNMKFAFFFSLSTNMHLKEQKKQYLEAFS